MKKNINWLQSLLFIFMFCLCACSNTNKSNLIADNYKVGFSSHDLQYENMEQYYIAGYKGGRHPQGILDPQKIKSCFIDNGIISVLIITVDCIGLDSGTISKIQQKLSRFKQETKCYSINVISTHTHAGVDTLGLWGPKAINGKNDDFMNQLIESSEIVAYEAYNSRVKGDLFYSATETSNIQEDSRAPHTFDPNIYQIKFVPTDPSNNGLRIVSYAAHAESLRGDNLFISADFPGEISKIIKEQTGDDFIFIPGAIGGLIKTKEFATNKTENMSITASKLANYIINHSREIKLTYDLKTVRVTFEIKLENTLFLYYKFLGILNSSVSRNMLGTYYLLTELSLIQLGQITLFLIPGEIFPELLTELNNTAQINGFNHLIPFGLANDEIGYIIPRKDFIIDADAPYLTEVPGHYEETNSVGPNTEDELKNAFNKAITNIKKETMIKSLF